MADVNPKKVAAEPTPADTPAPVVTPAVPPASNPDDDLLKNLDQFVMSTVPDEKIIESMQAMRKEARVMMECVIKHSPDVPRRREALRHVQVSMLCAITAMLMPRMQFEKSKEESNA